MRAALPFRALGPIDARSVGRESMLAWLLPLPLVLGVVVRFAWPPLEVALGDQLGTEMAAYRELLASYCFVMLTPLLVGFVTGFLLLDERDDHTFTALLVTPLSLESYLLYRIGAPLLVCTAMSLVALAISGLASVSWPSLIAIQLMAALEGPIIALLLASLADDKVRGFAVMKAMQAVMLVPVVAWFIDPPLQWAAGLIPTYWPLRAYWSAGQPGPGFGIALGAGFAVHLGLLAWLLGRFRRLMHR